MRRRVLRIGGDGAPGVCERFFGGHFARSLVALSVVVHRLAILLGDLVQKVGVVRLELFGLEVNREGFLRVELCVKRVAFFHERGEVILPANAERQGENGEGKQGRAHGRYSVQRWR